MPYCFHCGFEYTPKLAQGFCTNCGSRVEEQTTVSAGTMQLTRVPRFAGKLVTKSGIGGGQTFELTRDRVTIGSAPRSGVTLDHSSVSPFHAIIRVSQGRFVIYDAGSAGGTWANGEPVTGELLTYGARISIGATELLFARPEPGLTSGTRGALVIRPGPEPGQSFPIGNDDVVIGRGPGAGGVQLMDRTASQRHALVHPIPEGCVLFDLASNNGTMINGVPLRGTPLYGGDLIRLGEVELQFLQDTV